MTAYHVDDQCAKATPGFDSTPAVRKAIAEAIRAGAGSEVVFGEGKYFVEAEKGETLCFTMENAEGLTIRGQGPETEIIVTNPRNGVFGVKNGNMVFIKDLVIDYDPPPFTQGVLVAVDPDAHTYDLEIEEGFPLLSEPWFKEAGEPYGKWGMIFDRNERRLKAGAPDATFCTRWEQIGERVWRMWAEEKHLRNPEFMEVGDRFVHMARRSSTFAMGFLECVNCSVSNTVVHSCPSVSILLVGCQGQTIRGHQVRYREGTPRLLTTDSDGIHCSGNRRGPWAEDCHFEGMADDTINIYCPPNIVYEVLSPTEIVVGKRCKIREGDRLQVLEPQTGTIRSEVVAEKVVEQDERFAVTLAEPVDGMKAGTDHTDGDTVFNLSASGEGYVIRNNHMGPHRRHGILLRAGRGIVEGNTIDGTAGLGIVVTNEPNWPEGPMAKGIAIRGNTVKGVGYALGYGSNPVGAAIQVKGTQLGHAVAQGRGKRDISVEENTIIDAPGAAIFVGAAQNVRIAEIEVEVTPGAKPHRETGAVVLDNCDGVSIEGLKVNDPRPETTSAIEIRDTVDGGDEGVSVNGLDAKLNENSAEIDDQRSS